MTEAASNMHDEFGIRLNGEPGARGGFLDLVLRATWPTEQGARDAAARVHVRPAGLRVMHRVVSDWAPADETVPAPRTAAGNFTDEQMGRLPDTRPQRPDQTTSDEKETAS